MALWLFFLFFLLIKNFWVFVSVEYIIQLYNWGNTGWAAVKKGGKVVEKIRKESGTKIRVLSDKLPACATPSDEMIEVYIC